MENINIEDFRVKGAIKLADFATELYLDSDKKDEVEALDKIQKKLSEKQIQSRYPGMATAWVELQAIHLLCGP